MLRTTLSLAKNLENHLKAIRIKMHQQNIGIDIGGTKVLVVSGNKRLKVETGSDFTPEKLEGILRNFLHANKIEPVSIGIAVPGLIDSTGKVVFCDVLPKLTGWNPNLAFADFRCQIKALNDANAAILDEFSELEDGLTAGIVMVGTAIGAAFITEGKLLTGATGLAGELGYMPMQTNRGIERLDELAGGSFLAAKHGVSAKSFANLIEVGDRTAIARLCEGGRYLGVAVASVINLINPSRLAFGGGTVGLPGYFEAVVETAAKYTIPDLWSACELSKVRSGELVVALGAMRAAQI